ncbi:uncharacterized protein LOC143509733 [Brachyhypopomus gauderio]|uniref:uncharacterized protein LOC143509733 n=1 Tax=Brachyhypopomus gauderio TaxID=698409 RepID=UPI004040EF98
MFGRQPRLPIDIAFGLHPEHSKVSHSEYVKNLTESLTESYRLAIGHSRKQALQNKRRFDNKVRESTLVAGDRVLARNVGLRGKHKIADRWSETIYNVVKQIPDSPVYVVVPENTDGPERVLHRDLLLPCGFLPSEYGEVHPVNSKPKAVPKQSQVPGYLEIEEEIEFPEIEDGVQYYSSYDQISNVMKDMQTNQTSQDSVLVDAGLLENSNSEESPQSVSHGENIPEPSTNETTSSHSFSLNPEAVVFQPTLASVDEHDEQPSTPTAHGDLPGASVDVSTEHDGPQEVTEIVTEATDLTGSGQDHKELGQTSDGTALRRSSRERVAPRKLTYPTLGNPLVTVMHYILQGLDEALSETSAFDPMAINSFSL